MQLLIHTIRVLNYVVREDLFDKPIGSFPADVCPAEHRDEVYDQLERLEFIPRDDRAVGGVPIQVNGRKRGQVKRLAAQYRGAEVEWQVLTSIQKRPDSHESYDAALAAEVDGEPITAEEVRDAAARLQEGGYITAMKTWGRDLLRPKLTARGANLLANDLTTITPTQQEAPMTHIDNSTSIKAGRDVVSPVVGNENTVNVVSASGDGSQAGSSFEQLRRGIEEARAELGDAADELLEHVDAAQELVSVKPSAARSLVQTVQDRLAEFTGSAAGAGLMTLAAQVAANLPS
ncbi:hypothetical protein ACH46Q_11355 [Micrococcus luteus]|uniref:hypothetical protein n=1 Tax=Micrococcus luteus TaxID=1270 RepID=UPI0037A796CE